MAVTADQHVGRLDVAMDVAGVVDGVERLAEARRDLARPLGLERALDPHQRPQVGSRDVAHHDVCAVAVEPGLVDRDHVGMLDRRRGAQLAQEPAPRLRIVEALGRDDLDRDVAPEAVLAGAVDHAHATAPDRLLDPAAAEQVTRTGRWHRFNI